LKDPKYKKKHFHEDWQMNFKSCILNKIPSYELLLGHAPNLIELSISFSSLRLVAKEDLYGLQRLKTLRLDHNQIEYLPGDLFEYTPNLVSVHFQRNQIKYIGHKILDPLEGLSYFNLIGNSYIDALYSNAPTLKGPKMLTLDQFKNEIVKRCGLPDSSDKDKLIQHLTTLCDAQKAQIADMTNLVDKLTLKSEPRKNLGPFDFTLILDNKRYKTYKSTLIEHSDLLATFFKENPDDVQLAIENVTESSLAAIVNYLNEGKKPSKRANLFEIYTASHRLHVFKLKEIVAEIMMREVNEENAYEYLMFCNEINEAESLKMKAFEEFQKNFPNQSLLEEIASRPGALKKLWDGKLEMDKLVAEMNLVD
jgi:hypothetical protein